MYQNTPSDPFPPSWQLPSESAAKQADAHAARAEQFLANAPEYSQLALAYAVLAVMAELRAIRFDMIERGVQS
jgi:hypothetical protein